MKTDFKFDYPELSEALYLALVDDAFYQVMEQSVEPLGISHADETESQQRKRSMLAYMDYSIQEAKDFGECFIPDNEHYGVSIWSKPLSSETSSKKQSLKQGFINEYLGKKSLNIYTEACTFMEQQSKPLVPHDSWYLSIIGVLPEYQGQGLGPGLVEPVLRIADELRVGTYLETFTERNKTFYQRLGYHTLKEIFEPNIEATYWLLYRPSQNS